jgi:hypothetical protein
MYPEKKGFRAFAEQDKARRLAKTVDETVDINAALVEAAVPVGVAPAPVPDDEPRPLELDRT